MTDGWGGDPGHSGAKPQMHLKGGMAMPHTQAPMSGENSGPARGLPESTSGEIAGWNTTVIGSGMNGGDTGNGGSGLYKKPSDY